MDDRPSVLLTLDTATCDIYERMAALQGTDRVDLMQYLLAGIAPVVAEAANQAQRDGERGRAYEMRLYARLLRGGMRVGQEGGCTLLTQAGEEPVPVRDAG